MTENDGKTEADDRRGGLIFGQVATSGPIPWQVTAADFPSPINQVSDSNPSPNENSPVGPIAGWNRCLQ